MSSFCSLQVNSGSYRSGIEWAMRRPCVGVSDLAVGDSPTGAAVSYAWGEIDG